MKTYYKRPLKVKATQITEKVFTADHPNPDHVRGVLYYPKEKEVYCFNKLSFQKGSIGDWIVVHPNGTLAIVPDSSFKEAYVTEVIDSVHAEGEPEENSES